MQFSIQQLHSFMDAPQTEGLGSTLHMKQILLDLCKPLRRNSPAVIRHHSGKKLPLLGQMNGDMVIESVRPHPVENVILNDRLQGHL
ncbi:hypothetical protein D3C81_2117650 [compost metagenome]